MSVQHGKKQQINNLRLVAVLEGGEELVKVYSPDRRCLETFRAHTAWTWGQAWEAACIFARSNRDFIKEKPIKNPVKSSLYNDSLPPQEGDYYCGIYIRRKYPNNMWVKFKLVDVVTPDKKDETVQRIMTEADAAEKPVEINVQVGPNEFCFPNKFDA